MPTGATKKGVAAGQDGQAKDMFFTRVFEFILKRTSDTHYQKLRHECLIAIDFIKKLHTRRTDKNIPLSLSEVGALSNVVLYSLGLAFETSHPSLICVAIKCFQKMMAYGYLHDGVLDLSNKNKSNGGVDEDTNPGLEPKLIERVVRLIASFHDFPDKGVQKHVIKALLISATSPTCGVHGTSLMLVVRTIYNVHLMSRSAEVQASSRAALTHILTVVFGRMENIPSSFSSFGETPPSSPSCVSSSSGPPSLPGGKGEEKEEGEGELYRPRVIAKALVASVFQSLGLDLSSIEEREREGEGEEGKGGVFSSDLASLFPSSSSSSSSSAPPSPSPSPSPSSSPSSSPVPSALPSSDIAPELLIVNVPPSPLENNPDVIFHDCYLIFRAFCKLSIKEAGGKKRKNFSSEEIARVQKPNSLDLKSKILALQFILLILQSSGSAIQRHDKFVNLALKRQLCVGVLSINGVSPVPQVFRLSLAIFSVLIANFKNTLKTEIGIFFEKIFLRILESCHSTIGQKKAVLDVLHSVCSHPQTLVDIFLNYDCDIEDPCDVFERMVNDLSAITKGKGFSVDDSSEGDQKEIRKLGLECLVTIMRSLVDWSKELFENDEVFEIANTTNATPNNTESSASSLPSLQSFSSFSTLSSFSSLFPSSSPARPVSPAPSSPDPSLSASPSSPPSSNTFERHLMFNQQVKKGKQRFNIKASDGIKYLIGIGYIQDNPKDIASFLFKGDDLDRALVGEYLGGKDEIHRLVLYEYVEANFHFKNLEFDLAIRQFLSHFRLPKEAQQIDRIMEKFAGHYYNQNSDSVFENADAAYVLAYAVIMLATDLHSAAITKKITLDEWAHNLRKTNDEKDFPKDFLQAIFSRTEAAPLKLGMDVASRHAEGVLTPEQRKVLFHQETSFMTKKSRETLREKLRSKNVFFKSTNIRHVRPMFSIAWCPMLAAFSYMLESTNDSQAADLCLEGFQCGIRVAGIFFMETEQKAFTISLANFTLLDNHIRQIQEKNIKAIKAILSLARTDGNYLQDSWSEILACVSRLESAFLVATGLPQPLAHMARPKEMETQKSETEASGKLLGLNHKEENAKMIFRDVPSVEIDRVFSRTKSLNGNAIVDFVRCLCLVSLDEIKGDPPRTYSLQKVVEVAYENMGRIRLVWSRIWSHIGAHFTHVGLSSDKKLAMCAVDSLLQLANKFLEKDELSNYNFQKSFLKPFSEILSSHPSVQIREFVMHCLFQMIRSRAKNIQSGWKTILLALNSSAHDSTPLISQMSFEMSEVVVNSHFSLVSGKFFGDLVECLGAHACSQHSNENCLKAIKLLSFCADQLAKGEVRREEGLRSSFSDSSSNFDFDITVTVTNHTNNNGESGECLSGGEEREEEEGEEGEHIKLWFPVFLSLSRAISHKDLQVRTSAVKHLFSLLKAHGHSFSQNFWRMIFRGVLLPIFDNVQYIEDQPNKETAQWLTTTCQTTLNHVTGLFLAFFRTVSHLLHDCLVLLVRCILQNNEKLASMAVTALFSLISSNIQKWNPDMWFQIYTSIGFILAESVAVTSEGLWKGRGEGRVAMVVPNPVKRVRSLSSDSASVRSDSNSYVSNDFEFCPLEKQQKSISDLDSEQLMTVLFGKARVRLNVVKGVAQVMKAPPSLPFPILVRILDALSLSLPPLRSLNGDSSLWGELGDSSEELWKTLIEEEHERVNGISQMMFHLYKNPSSSSSSSPLQSPSSSFVPSFSPLIEQRLLGFCTKEIVNYTDLTQEEEGEKKRRKKNKAQKEESLKWKTKGIVFILSSLFSLPDPQYAKHTETLYPIFCDLMMANEPSVRAELRKLFLRTSSFVHFHTEAP